MSDGAWTAVGVVIGAALAPTLAAIGAWFRRRWERADRQADEKRRALYDLQDALLEMAFVRAQPSEMPGGGNEELWRWQAERDQLHGQAARKVRVCAARVGDARLWALVNPPPINVLTVRTGNEHGIFPFADELDEINARVRELLMQT